MSKKLSLREKKKFGHLQIFVLSLNVVCFIWKIREKVSCMKENYSQELSIEMF